MGREKSKKTRGEHHGDTKATGVGKQGQKSGSPEPGGPEDTPYGAGVQPLSGGGQEGSLPFCFGRHGKLGRGSPGL